MAAPQVLRPSVPHHFLRSPLCPPLCQALGHRQASCLFFAHSLMGLTRVNTGKCFDGRKHQGLKEPGEGPQDSLEVRAASLKGRSWRMGRRLPDEGMGRACETEDRACAKAWGQQQLQTVPWTPSPSAELHFHICGCCSHPNPGVSCSELLLACTCLANTLASA